MREDSGVKSFLYPQPILTVATYGEDGTPDVMNATWGGAADVKQAAMYLSANHRTVKSILVREAFTVGMADIDRAAECNYLDIVSANQVPDRVARAGLHVTKSAHADASLIDELPLVLEYQFVSFGEENELSVSGIINVNADERILNVDSTIDPARLHSITFDMANNVYLALGEKMSNAFQDGKELK